MIALPRSTEPLQPDRYTEPAFEPRLSFEIGPGGAWVARQFVDGFFDVQQDPESLDVIAVQFCRPTAVYATSRDELRPATAAEAIAALRANPELAVGAAWAATVAGSPALAVDVDTSGPPASDPPVFSPVLRIAAGPIGLATARRLRIFWLDRGDGPLAVLIGGSIAGWDRALVAAEPVIDSIRFEEGAA